MAPVATQNGKTSHEHTKHTSTTEVSGVFNPTYYPAIGDDGDDSYPFSEFKVRRHYIIPERQYNARALQPSFRKVEWEPLTEVPVTDRGLKADQTKKNLFSAAQKVKHLTPAIGTEILGIDLRQLSDPQKDEL